jgi:SPOR domain
VVRTVFFALLLVNLAYFAWAHWVDVPSPPPANAIATLPRLKLAEELPPDQRTPKTAQKTALNAPCQSVGPFTDSDNTARIAALLKGKGFEPKERAEEAQSSEGYWVYIGGLKSESDVDKALVTLEHGGIKDAVPMPESPEAGRRLSLGMFSEHARAEKRAQTVREQTGLNAEIAERKRPATSYWLDVASPAGTGGESLRDLLAQGTSPHVGVQPCRSQPVAAPPTGTATAHPPSQGSETAAASTAVLPGTKLR